MLNMWREISQGGKTAKTFMTTNLKKHLHSRHRTQFEEFEQQEEARAAEKASGQSRGELAGHSKQVSLEFVVEKQRQFYFEFIAVDNQPFSVVDNIGFTSLVNCLEPRYKLPS